MWIVCDQTINLGGGKFLLPEKKLQVPNILGQELIDKGVAVLAELDSTIGYVASQQNDEDEDETIHEVDEPIVNIVNDEVDVPVVNIVNDEVDVSVVNIVDSPIAVTDIK